MASPETQAIALHREGKEDSAIEAYHKLVNNGTRDYRIYINYAVLLKKKDNVKNSQLLLEHALKIGVRHPWLFNNLANIYVRSESPCRAIPLLLDAIKEDPNYLDPTLTLASLLHEQGHKCLGRSILINHLSNKNLSSKDSLRICIGLLGLYSHESYSNTINSTTPSLLRYLESTNSLAFLDLEPLETLQFLLAKIQILGETASTEALINVSNSINKLTSELKLADPANYNKAVTRARSGLWNLSCVLLRKGSHELGWKYYDNGLQVPAPAPQKWQRALFKPYTFAELPLLSTDSLVDAKSILLLGEQGIGDAMMFVQCITHLRKKTSARITVALNKRLVPIYKDSLRDIDVLIDSEVRIKYPDAKSNFDFQLPIGSLSRLLSLTPENTRSPGILLTDEEESSKLREKYINAFNKTLENPFLLGISWQGGGRPDRISLKSVRLEELISLFNKSNIIPVSLQYGDDRPHVNKFNNTYSQNLLHDDSIDPVSDLHGFLPQVKAMDAVISIANTTVHCSGGLNVPTLCLVSKSADWRWLKPDIYKGSYWYSTVDAAYQDESGSWKQAIQQAEDWLDQQIANTK